MAIIFDCGDFGLVIGIPFLVGVLLPFYGLLKGWSATNFVLLLAGYFFSYGVIKAGVNLYDTLHYIKRKVEQSYIPAQIDEKLLAKLENKLSDKIEALQTKNVPNPISSEVWNSSQLTEIRIKLMEIGDKILEQSDEIQRRFENLEQMVNQRPSLRNQQLTHSNQTKEISSEFDANRQLFLAMKKKDPHALELTKLLVNDNNWYLIHKQSNTFQQFNSRDEALNYGEKLLEEGKRNYFISAGKRQQVKLYHIHGIIEDDDGSVTLPAKIARNEQDLNQQPELKFILDTGSQCTTILQEDIDKFHLDPTGELVYPTYANNGGDNRADEEDDGLPTYYLRMRLDQQPIRLDTAIVQKTRLLGRDVLSRCTFNWQHQLGPVPLTLYHPPIPIPIPNFDIFN